MQGGGFAVDAGVGDVATGADQDGAELEGLGAVYIAMRSARRTEAKE